MRSNALGLLAGALVLAIGCSDQPADPTSIDPGTPGDHVVTTLDPLPEAVWGRVSGGGQMLNEGWRVSFAGEVAGYAEFTPSTGSPRWTGDDLDGQWVVQFHNVSNPAVSGGTFKSTAVGETLFILPAEPVPNCNAAAHFWLTGRFNSVPGWSVRVLITDVGPAVTKDAPDKARVYLLDPSGTQVYGMEDSGDFPLEGSCLGPNKSGVDRGNVRVEVQPR